MEKIEFINKIWIKKGPYIWERFLMALLAVYCALQVFIFLMGDIDARSVWFVFLAFILLVWYRKQVKKKGEYRNSKCILSFEASVLYWEYPMLQVEDGRTGKYVRYKIPYDSIVNIAVSHELRSIRLVCRPELKVEENRKIKIKDFEGKKETCTLVLYYEEIDIIKDLFIKYAAAEFEIVD